MKQGGIAKIFGAVTLSWCWGAPAAAQEAATAPAAPAAPAAAPASPQTPNATPAGTSVAPPTEAPAPEPTPRAAFWSNQPGLSFHYVKLARENSDFVPGAWQRLCLAECDNPLLPGSYRLALGAGASDPVMAPGVFRVTKSSRFEGAYTDHSGTRLAGALVLGLGGVSSLSTLALGITTSGMSYDSKDGMPFIVAGVVGTLLSFAIGLPLATTPDEARIEQTAN